MSPSTFAGGHSSHQQPPVCELCSCTFAATETVVDCGRLRLYDMPRGFPANTTSLDLSYNELTGLYEGDFDGGLALLRTLLVLLGSASQSFFSLSPPPSPLPPPASRF